jgi:hypothetical protein
MVFESPGGILFLGIGVVLSEDVQIQWHRKDKDGVYRCQKMKPVDATHKDLPETLSLRPLALWVIEKVNGQRQLMAILHNIFGPPCFNGATPPVSLNPEA